MPLWDVLSHVCCHAAVKTSTSVLQLTDNSALMLLACLNAIHLAETTDNIQPTFTSETTTHTELVLLASPTDKSANS